MGDLMIIYIEKTIAKADLMTLSNFLWGCQFNESKNLNK